MALKSFFDSDQNLPLHQNNALKCKTLTWRKRGNLVDRYVQNINNVNEKIINSKEEKTSMTMSIGNLDGGITESSGENRRQRLHLQHHSGKNSQWQASWSSWYSTSSDKWWCFRFLEKNSRKSTESVDRTPIHKTHLCNTV